MTKINKFKKGDIIYATNINDKKDLIEYESFVCTGYNNYIELWYLGMIVNKNYIIDANLNPRKIYKSDNSIIKKIGSMDPKIVNLFNKMNKEYNDEVK